MLGQMVIEKWRIPFTTHIDASIDRPRRDASIALNDGME